MIAGTKGETIAYSDEKPESMDIELKMTRDELFKDWLLKRDRFGQRVWRK